MNKIFIASVALLIGSAVLSTIYGINYYSNYTALDREKWDNLQWIECSIENFSLSTHTMGDCEEASPVVKSNV